MEEPAAIQRKHALENLIPPPLVFLLFGIAMRGVARLTPALLIDRNTRLVIAGLLILVAAIFSVLGVTAFRKAKTALDPVRPDKASKIVTTGVYGYTCNPMYVGLATGLLGWAVWLSNPWTLLGPIVFVLFTTRFQIIPEEKILSAKFGREYDEYRNRVRRWL